MNAVSTSDRGELVMLKSLPIILATLHSKIYCAALLSEIFPVVLVNGIVQCNEPSISTCVQTMVGLEVGWEDGMVGIVQYRSC